MKKLGRMLLCFAPVFFVIITAQAQEPVEIVYSDDIFVLEYAEASTIDVNLKADVVSGYAHFIQVAATKLKRDRNGNISKSQVILYLNPTEEDEFKEAISIIHADDTNYFSIFAPKVKHDRGKFEKSSEVTALRVITGYGRELVDTTQYTWLAEENASSKDYAIGVFQFQHIVFYPNIFIIPGKNKVIYQSAILTYEMSNDKIRQRSEITSFLDSAEVASFSSKQENATLVKSGLSLLTRGSSDSALGFTTPGDAEWDGRPMDEMISDKRSLYLKWNTTPIGSVEQSAYGEAVQDVSTDFSNTNTTLKVVQEKSTSDSLRTSITWNAIEGSELYVVRIHYESGASRSWDRKSTKILLDNLVLGSKYIVTVIAKDASGNILGHDEISFTQ